MNTYRTKDLSLAKYIERGIILLTAKQYTSTYQTHKHNNTYNIVPNNSTTHTHQYIIQHKEDSFLTKSTFLVFVLLTHYLLTIYLSIYFLSDKSQTFIYPKNFNMAPIIKAP